jgi:hypothetical protein
MREVRGATLNQSHLRWIATWMVRLPLAFSFLSAVADRFGLWGPFGTAGVAWGDFERLTAPDPPVDSGPKGRWFNSSHPDWTEVAAR